MQCRRARTHAVSTGQTDFPVKFHGENTPALPGVRKGKSGRLLRRPQPDHPAATVDEFCTAVLTGKGIGIVSPADTKPVPASKIKLNPAACHNRRRVFMPHIRNYLDRQKASLLLCIAIRRKPPIPQPRKHGIGIHIIPPRNLTNRNPRNPRLRDVVARTQVVLVIGCSTSDLDT